MNDENIISRYSLQQAIEDGIIIEIFKNRWDTLTSGKPLVATAHIYNELSLAALQAIWNEYVVWRRKVMPTLPEEEQMFHTTMNSETVWVLEDGDAFTILYPDDY